MFIYQIRVDKNTFRACRIICIIDRTQIVSSYLWRYDSFIAVKRYLKQRIFTDRPGIRVLTVSKIFQTDRHSCAAVFSNIGTSFFIFCVKRYESVRREVTCRHHYRISRCRVHNRITGSGNHDGITGSTQHYRIAASFRNHNRIASCIQHYRVASGTHHDRVSACVSVNFYSYAGFAVAPFTFFRIENSCRYHSVFDVNIVYH